MISVMGDWIHRRQAAHYPSERPHRGRRAAGLTLHINRRRGIRMDRKTGDATARGDQTCEADVEFADRVRCIFTWRRHAVAARIGRPGTGVVIALVRREHEQRIALIDAVTLEARE